MVSNPAERLAGRFTGEPISGCRIATHAFPVSYREAPARMRALLEAGGEDGRPFDVVLMLGVAAGFAKWRVERMGKNACHAAPDADGCQPPGLVLVEDGPEQLAATLPVDRIAQALKEAGLPVVLSDDAGGYLCNALLYTTLHAARSLDLPAQIGFLHVPADEMTFAPGSTATLFPFSEHVRAVEAVLKALTTNDVSTAR